MRLLFDTNIVLDVLLNRAPFIEEAGLLWVANDEGTITGAIAATTLTDIFYVTRKTAGLETARQAVRICLEAFDLCRVDRETIEYAQSLPGTDFEDNVQIACATLTGLEAIVTRDKTGFEDSIIPIFSPREIINRLALTTSK